LEGPTDLDAIVSSFNGVLAGEAAGEVLRLLSGVGGGRDKRLLYDGLEGTFQPLVVKSRRDCSLCEETLAAGDPVWGPIGGAGKH
jgi:hypothetical protein